MFEKNDRIGGPLRYGIPDFKMEKKHIDLRIRQMEGEGVIFRPRMHIGIDVSVQRLLDDYQVLVPSAAARKRRDLPIPGRELDGVHYAMGLYAAEQAWRATKKMAAPGGNHLAPSGK